MDLPYSKIDYDFIKLLEVDGCFLKRIFFKNVVDISKKFYTEYVNWCNKNNKYVDFIQPLCWHLYCSGISGWKIRMYLKRIASKIETYVTKEISNGGNTDD